MSINQEELNKIIAVKQMDLAECEQELNNRFYPSIVRTAMINYISVLRQQLDSYDHDRNR